MMLSSLFGLRCLTNTLTFSICSIHSIEVIYLFLYVDIYVVIWNHLEWMYNFLCPQKLERFLQNLVFNDFLKNFKTATSFMFYIFKIQKTVKFFLNYFYRIIAITSLSSLHNQKTHFVRLLKLLLLYFYCCCASERKRNAEICYSEFQQLLEAFHNIWTGNYVMLL